MEKTSLVLTRLGLDASFAALATTVCTRLLGALLAYLLGRFLIRQILALLEKSRAFKRLDHSVQGYSRSALQGVLTVILIISIVSILGVPMASVVTVLASAGVAVGLALQGSLSNLAGGIMLMIFHPFREGDYVDAAGVSGTVQEVTLFYTVILTLDNKRITVPNGTLMNANVVNYSAEPLRRVDLTFSTARGEDSQAVCAILREAMERDERVLTDPAPFARLTGGDKDSMTFTLRAWCKNEDYWNVYFDLTETITAALGKAGVKAPATRVVSE